MYRTGDVILYTKLDPLGLFVRLGYFLRHLVFTDLKAVKCTHTATFINAGEIVEAATPRVHLVPFAYNPQQVEIWRRKVNTESVIKDYLVSEVNKSYSWYTYLFLVVLGIFRLEWLLNGIAKNGVICSELTAKAHIREGYKWKSGVRIFLGLTFGRKSPDMLTPYDIAREIYSNPNEWERVC